MLTYNFNLQMYLSVLIDTNINSHVTILIVWKLSFDFWSSLDEMAVILLQSNRSRTELNSNHILEKTSRTEPNSDWFLKNLSELNRTRTVFSKVRSNRTELEPIFQQRIRTELDLEKLGSIRPLIYKSNLTPYSNVNFWFQ
jgi:hypothetical protein